MEVSASADGSGVTNITSGVISRGAKGAWAPLEFRNICTRLQFAPKMLQNIDFPHEVEGWIRFCTPYELTEFLRKIQNVVKIVIYLEL